MGKVKNLFKSVRIIIALVFIILAIVAIHPSFSEGGVAIRSVASNSSASLSGVESPKASSAPMSRERIISIDGRTIDNLATYNEVLGNLKPGQVVKMHTDKDSYTMLVRADYNITVLPELVNVTKTLTHNVTINGTIQTVTENITSQENKTIRTLLGPEDLGLNVYPAPSSNIRKGLDLQGGTRVILEPDTKVSSDDIALIIDNLKQRLNVFGLSDIVVREVKDLEGNQFVLIEVPGANEKDVRSLVAGQGKFEAMVGSQVIFEGSKKDITHVCRSAECSGIDPQSGCAPISENQWACRFRFSISLSAESAQRQANVTSKLSISPDVSGGDRYLNESLDLYLDDKLVDSLNIGEELKGQAIRDIAISGSGIGATQQEAMTNALDNMKRLQTILVTGSLPVKMNIVKVDSISPVLGEEFVKNALVLAIVAIIGVVTVMFIRYRNIVIVGPVIFTLLTEILLLLGMASLIGWNLDIAAIAGIIVAVGTGVDDQIVISDEVLGKRNSRYTSWRERIKNAFFVIFAAFFTTVAAMVPLLFAGAGLVKGFALTTIMGVTIGVLISRPAFAAMLEILTKDQS